jgi:restriction system protein
VGWWAQAHGQGSNRVPFGTSASPPRKTTRQEGCSSRPQTKLTCSLSGVTDGPHIPAYSDLLWPSLRAVREIGDSGTNEEIVEKVIATEGFTDEQLDVPSNDGRRGLIEYRLAWARSYLKGMGLLDNSRRGVWSTTDLGRSCMDADIPALYASYTSELRDAQRQKRAAHAGEDPSEPLGEHDLDVSSPWKEQLISTLLEMSPEQFERLARRLLREAGFVSATVTGKAGDGGSTVSASTGFRC